MAPNALLQAPTSHLGWVGGFGLGLSQVSPVFDSGSSGVIQGYSGFSGGLNVGLGLAREPELHIGVWENWIGARSEVSGAR